MVVHDFFICLFVSFCMFVCCFCGRWLLVIDYLNLFAYFVVALLAASKE
jgi:hypothetical protein